MIGLTQELVTENIVFDGYNREYIVYIPETYSQSIPSPILMAFHGGDGYAHEFMSYEADFRSIADTAGFILVYPQALEDPIMRTIVQVGYTKRQPITMIFILLMHCSMNYLLIIQ